MTPPAPCTRSGLALLVALATAGLLAVAPRAAIAQPEANVPADVLGAELRVPLALSLESGLGVFQPCAAANARPQGAEPRGERLRSLLDAARPEPDLPEVAAGAGLSWRMTDRVELFGEYRFLHLRPETDDPLFGAGSSIRLY